MTGIPLKFASEAAEQSARAQQTAPQEWFSVAELADLSLPGLASSKRALSRRAQDEGWATRCALDGTPLVQARAGRGGGLEFHISLLPGPARVELVRRGIAASPDVGQEDRSQAGSWSWFERQPQKTRDTAAFRLQALQKVDALVQSGISTSAAVAEVARQISASKATVWNWRSAVDGISQADWLPALAPRRIGGGRAAEIDADIWKIFLSDYLRPSSPALSACYHRVAAIAVERGLSLPSEKSFSRRLEREVHPAIQTLKRKGDEALRRSLPAQRRSVVDLDVLQLVNADGHTFDVRVYPPGGGEPCRPVMVAIQDIRSSKVLAWRIGESESAHLVRLAFADLFEDFGIPAEALLDNGRGFASKWITGAQANRFRFKVLPSDPAGLLTGMGVRVHWAMPYRGQSKPIERAFRDLCETISRHPATEGAYIGNNVLNKPHNYGSRVMEWTEFCAHVERGLAFHNAKAGRRGRDYNGRSFDQVFEEGYARSVIRKASKEQMRLALLTAQRKRVNRQTGEINLFGNRYWSEECMALHGQQIVVRFDPDDLMRPIHLYDLEGRYLADAPIMEDRGFLDAEAARRDAKAQAAVRKKVRELAAAEKLLEAERVAAVQADIERAVTPEPAVVQLVHHRKSASAAQRKPEPEADYRSEHESEIVNALGKVNLRLVE
ncbi:MAG: transposase domain-containing protein [Sphingomonadaceae bacterium]